MAIAFDSATNPALANASSLTFSHTTAGSDRLLYVGAMARGTTITVAYNSASMTEIGSRVLVSGTDYMSHFYLVAPTTGANNVVVTGSGTHILIAGAVSYTGVSQTGQPDANNNQAVTTSSNLTTSVTTVADNSWVVLSARCNNDGASSAGTGTTLRADTSGYIQLYDKNGAVTPAGSASVNTTQTSQLVVHLVASFSPVSAGGSPTYNALSLSAF